MDAGFVNDKQIPLTKSRVGRAGRGTVQRGERPKAGREEGEKRAGGIGGR